MSKKQTGESARRYVGVDVGGTKILAALVTEAGVILDRQRTPTPQKASGKQTVACIQQAIDGVLAKQGVEDFYQGRIARQIHLDMKKHDGLISRDDLAQIPQPIERRPVSCHFDGLRVITFPPPGAGLTR